ncbi:MAG: glycosyltransferase family 2 protein [Methylococcales bacterium]|nr:MAG: glycosyltransferase family 2 protein [Methylococcales bacterium]
MGAVMINRGNLGKVPVSVIIPCYRCADTIKRALDSVIAQTLPPEEIILIDDFSNDDGVTLAALDQLWQGHQKTSIKIVQLDKNSGPASARNAGWKEASQPYLAFLDADDSWHPKKLEIQYQWMAAHSDIVLSGHQSIKISENVALPELPESLVVRRVNKYSLLFSNRFPTRSVMVKRDVSYRFPPEKRYAEDYLLWLTIVFDGQPAWFLNSPMAYSFKEDFGDGGLTGNLWKNQLGVLDTYHRIFSAGFIPLYVFILISGFSFFKYLRRLGITKVRSLFNGRVTSSIVS